MGFKARSCSCSDGAGRLPNFDIGFYLLEVEQHLCAVSRLMRPPPAAVWSSCLIMSAAISPSLTSAVLNHAWKPSTVFWLTAVGPTNFSLQVNIFVVYSMKTKCFTGSQKYKVKQIWGFMTVMELFFSVWKLLEGYDHVVPWQITIFGFWFPLLKEHSIGPRSKMSRLITFLMCLTWPTAPD